MCMILGRPSQAASLLVILDLQLAHSLCRSELPPCLQPSQTDISHIPPPVSPPQSQVGMHSNGAITRDPVVMSICVFFPHGGLADRGSHSARPSRVTAEMWRGWLDTADIKAPWRTQTGAREVQVNATVQEKRVTLCLSMVEESWRMSPSASSSPLSECRK